MKITAIILLVTCMQLSAAGYAQNVTLSLNNVSLQKVFTEINHQTGYQFFYKDELLSKAGTVSIEVKNTPIEKVLSQCLKNMPVTFSIVEGTIILKEVKPEINNVIEVPPPIIVSGSVKDAKTGESIVGVTVRIEGTSDGVITDVNGKFMLKIPKPDVVLVFSCVGYDVQRVALKGQLVLGIRLMPSLAKLDEVVVVGYGTQKKGSVIGAVDRINPDALKLPTRTISTSLAGRLAGIIAVQSSGEPGYDGATFWIRGINTFAGSTAPLILVDGVERNIDGIDPDEIADFTILKDATATAVYGVRGANGVVLVTTKRGVVGKPSINLRIENGFTSPLQLPKFVDGPTYMTIQNEALRNMGNNPLFTQQQIDRTRSGYDPYYYPNVNWLDIMIKPISESQHATINISGGSDNMRYFVSGAYISQDGMYKTTNENSFNSNINLKRYNFRTNVDMNVSKTTLLSLTLAGSLENRNYPGSTASNIFYRIQEIPPVWFPASYPDKTKIPGFGDTGVNPYQVLAHSGYSTEYYSRVQSNMAVTQQFDFITKGLTGKFMFAFDGYGTATLNRIMQPRPYLIKPWSFDTNGDPVLLNAEGKYNYVDQAPSSSSYSNYLNLSSSQNTSRNMYTEASLIYNHQFGKHAIGGLLLYNQSDNLSPADASLYGSIPSRSQGLAGRINYAFNDKYFAEYNFGYNGSENYAKGKRLGFFPSYAIGWVPTKESFMKFMLPVIDFMKIRLSRGAVGNDRSNNRFSYITRVATTATNVGFGSNNGFGYGTGAGIDITYYGNPDATWETATKTDFGAELHFLKYFTMNIDAFKEVRNNIWTQLTEIPSIFGFANLIPSANIGKMENKGFDGYLQYSQQVNKDFNITFKGTFTYAANKILATGDVKPLYEYQSRIGQNVSANFGYIAEGLFIDKADIAHSPSQIFLGSSNPGDIKYRDINKDGKIDDFDRVYIGNPTVPKITYGFGSSMSFKGFDLSFLLQGAAQVSFFAMPKAFKEVNFGNIYTIMRDSRWEPETQNLSASFPRLGVGSQNNNYVPSTFWLKDGSYLRLKQVEIGFTLPSVSKRLHAKNIRIYANSLNLLTFSSFKWWDAESMNSNGIYYPIQRVVNIGVDIKF